LHDFQSLRLCGLKEFRGDSPKEVQDIAGLARVHPAQEFDFDAQLRERAARLKDLNLEPAVGERERSQMVKENPHTPLKSTGGTNPERGPGNPDRLVHGDYRV